MKSEQIKRYLFIEWDLSQAERPKTQQALIRTPYRLSSWQSALWQHCLFLHIILFCLVRLFSTRGFIVQAGVLPPLLIVIKPYYWVITTLYEPRSQTEKRQPIRIWEGTHWHKKTSRETMKREKHSERLYGIVLYLPMTVASGAMLVFPGSFPI